MKTQPNGGNMKKEFKIMRKTAEMKRMLEAEKIEEMIEQYKELFQATDMDICRSLKGKWYFFRFSKKCKSYDCYTEFETAEELLKLIIGELAMDITHLLNKDVHFPARLHCDLTDFMEQKINYDDEIHSLAKFIDVLTKYSAETCE